MFYWSPFNALITIIYLNDIHVLSMFFNFIFNSTFFAVLTEIASEQEFYPINDVTCGAVVFAEAYGWLFFSVLPRIYKTPNLSLKNNPANTRTANFLLIFAKWGQKGWEWLFAGLCTLYCERWSDCESFVGKYEWIHTFYHASSWPLKIGKNMLLLWKTLK